MFLYKKDEKRNLYNKTLLIIFMALDDNVIYQALTSMASALEYNNNEKNILVYNLFCFMILIWKILNYLNH